MAVLQSGSLSLSNAVRNLVTPWINIDPKTASLNLRIARPTTAAPLTWAATGRIQATVVLEIDGVEHRTTGTSSGGIRLLPLGRGEATHYVFSWLLPYGFFDTESVPERDWDNLRARRIGETAQTFRARVEFERLAGTINTSYSLEDSIEDAPQDWRYHHSIAYQNATAVVEQEGDATISTSFDAGAGSNRAAWVVAGSNRTTMFTAHAVTYGGASPSITRPANATATNFQRTTGDVFIDSEIGSGAKTVQLVASGGASTIGGVTLAIVTLTGVDQTTPVGTGFAVGSDDGTGITLTVTNVGSTDLVLDGLSIWNAPGTIGANQTQRATAAAANLTTKISTQAGSDGGVMSWGNGSGEMAYVAVAFKETKTAAITGTATASINEADVVAGGKTIIITLSGDTFVANDVTNIQLVGRQRGSFAGTTSAQDITFALTGGLASTPAAGDLVFVSYAIGTAGRTPTLIIETTGGTDYTNALPSGQIQVTADAFDSILRAAYRFMPGTPETQVRLTSSAGGSGHAQDAGIYDIIVLRGIDTGTVMDVTATEASGQDTRLANPPSITPVTVGAWTFHCGAAACGAGGTFASSDLTDQQVGTQADTNDALMMAGTLAKPWASGAQNPAVFTGGGTDTANDSWTAFSVAFRPVVTDLFDNARQAIIDGLDSAQSEGTGWNAEVRDNEVVGAVVRTSSTVATITLTAAAAYNITAQETITVTVPATALTGAGAIVGTPTFTVDTAAGGTSVTPDPTVVNVTVIAPSLALNYTPAPEAVSVSVIAPTVALWVGNGVIIQVQAIVVAPTIALNLTPSPTTTNVSVTASSLSLALTPVAIAVSVSVVAPTVTLSITVTPTPTVVSVSLVAPTIALNFTPADTVVSVSVVATTVTLGFIITPNPIVVSVSLVAPTISLNYTPAATAVSVTVNTFGLSLNLTPAAIAVNVSVVAPSLNIGLPVVTASVSVVNPYVSLSLTPAPVVTQVSIASPSMALALTPAPVITQVSVVAPTVTLGVTVTPSPTVVSVSLVAPTISLNLTPAATSVSVSVTASTITLALTPASVVTTVAIASPTFSLNYTLTPVVVDVIVIAPTVNGAINVNLNPIVVTASVVAPSFALSLTPAPVLTQVSVVAITASFNLTPAATTVSVSVNAVDISLALTVGSVVVSVIVITPDITGAVLVTPAPIVVQASVVAPSLTISSTPETTVVQISLVAVSLSLGITPSPIVTSVTVVAPSNILALVLSPVQVPVIVIVPDISVSGGTTVVPSPTVVTVSVNTVYLSIYATAILDGCVILDELIDNNTWGINVVPSEFIEEIEIPVPSGFIEPIIEPEPSGFIKTAGGTNLWEL